MSKDTGKKIDELYKQKHSLKQLLKAGILDENTEIFYRLPISTTQREVIYEQILKSASVNRGVAGSGDAVVDKSSSSLLRNTKA